MTEPEIFSGFLSYIKQGPLGKRKVKRFAVVFKSSVNGLPRIEIYQSKETFEKKTIKSRLLKKFVHVINLDECTHITNNKPSDGKTTDFLITLHLGLEDEQTTFLFESPDDMNSWLHSLRLAIFGRNDNADTSFVYKVEIKSNEETEKLQLRGTYYLSVTPEEIELLCHDSRRLICKWPLPSLQSYGLDKQEFSLEAGRRSPTGPGIFCFKTVYYKAIWQKVENNIKIYAAKLELKSTSSTPSNPKDANKFAPSAGTGISSTPDIPSSSMVCDTPLGVKQQAR